MPLMRMIFPIPGKEQPPTVLLLLYKYFNRLRPSPTHAHVVIVSNPYDVAKMFQKSTSPNTFSFAKKKSIFSKNFYSSKKTEPDI